MVGFRSTAMLALFLLLVPAVAAGPGVEHGNEVERVTVCAGSVGAEVVITDGLYVTNDEGQPVAWTAVGAYAERC